MDIEKYKQAQKILDKIEYNRFLVNKVQSIICSKSSTKFYEIFNIVSHSDAKLTEELNAMAFERLEAYIDENKKEIKQLEKEFEEL